MQPMSKKQKPTSHSSVPSATPTKETVTLSCPCPGINQIILTQSASLQELVLAHISSGSKLTAVVKIARMFHVVLGGASGAATADTVVSVDVARAIGAGKAVGRRIFAAARILEINARHAVAERVAMPAAAEIV